MIHDIVSGNSCFMACAFNLCLAPTTPYIPSPLARTDALSLASNHPHARKQSVLDGQFSLDVLSPTTSVPPAPYTPNSSTSTFSLALDPIAEGTHSPYSSTPAIGSPTIEPVSFPHHNPTPTSNSVYAYPPPRSHSYTNHRPAPIGLGQPSNPPKGYPHHLYPHTTFATTFPPTNTELILYSYAQLTGTIQITPISGALPTADQSQTLHVLRSALHNRAVLGGGSMDINSTLNSPSSPALSPKPRYGQRHSRSSSFSSGLLSILSPTSLVSSISSPSPNTWTGPSRWRSSSTSSSSSPLVPAFGNGTEDVDPEEPLPTYEIQPAMLAVDLSLGPGESRSCGFSRLLFCSNRNNLIW